MIIGYDGQDIDFSDEFSMKVFHQEFVDIPDNTLVYASCFYREGFVDFHKFRDDMKGVSFYNCNLDNIFIPIENNVIGGSNRKILVQKDARDWELDESLVPTRVVNEKSWVKDGYSVDPADIPEAPINQEVMKKHIYDETFGQGKFPDGTLFSKIPTVISEETRKHSLVATQDEINAITYFKNVKDVTTDDLRKKLNLNPDQNVYEGEIDYVKVEGEGIRFNDPFNQIVKA